jgi:hypothetical protein
VTNLEIYTLLTAIFTGITSLGVYYLSKAYHAAKPVITRWGQSYNRINMFFRITNNAPQNITVKEIYVRKICFGKIPGLKPQQIEWKYPRSNDLLERRTVIVNEEGYSLHFPGIDPASSYKIYVMTSAGCCSFICRPGENTPTSGTP